MTSDFVLTPQPNVEITVRVPVMSGKIKVILNGHEVPQQKDKKDKPFILHYPDGTTKDLIVKKDSMWGLFPKAIIDRQTFELGKNLKWYEYIVGGIPMLLLFPGGAVGVILGIYATYYNYGVLRSNISKGKKATLTFASTSLSFMLWVAIGVIVYLLVTN
jgi:hypothetical protein